MNSISDDLTRRRKERAVPPWRWNAMLLVFVIAALAASVIIPARATSRIVDLFRELDDIVEPARRVTTRLQVGLDREAALLAHYASSRDRSSLVEYRAISTENNRQLQALSRLTHELGGRTASFVTVVRHNLESSRRSGHTEPDHVAALRSSVSTLQLLLADENQSRRAQVQGAGWLSLVSNVLLVLAALAAITNLIVHVIRESRLMHILRERATREASLRSAAEALAAAYALDVVAREIVRTAVSVLPAHGAFVVHIDEPSGGPASLVVQATAGSGLPARSTTCALSGSAAERALRAEAPILCTMHQYDELMRNVWMGRPSVSALVVPLHDGRAARGALILLSDAAFEADDMVWARTFGHLATLAYEKVRLLDSANESRRQLEIVMESRARLMRGFSHDVKNPLGAADGYTALILEGIYGELSTPQRESIERVRRSIDVALSLLEDLSDFARAEAGRITLNITTVDVAELARAIAVQYQASAAAKGLTLNVEVAAGLPLIDTDAARLQQVLSNFLSNSLKYTDAGSVGLRVGEATDPQGVLGNGIRFDISDTGPGIPQAQRTLIFDEFARLETTPHRGAGLGLAISKLLTEVLGGSISVDSEVGVGSTFSLWMPLSASKREGPPASPAVSFPATAPSWLSS